MDEPARQRHSRVLPAVPVEDDRHVSARDLEVEPAVSDESPLYEDVEAMDRVSRELVPRPEPAATQRPSALERGVREKPDGTVEHYERVEYPR